MKWWQSILIMILAVSPLPLINAIQDHRALSLSAYFIGNALGLSVGVILLGVLVGLVVWVPTRLLMGVARTPKAQYFVTISTLVVAVFLIVGNVGCLVQPNRCS